MLYLILIISLSYLHAVDNDLEKGIVYLEKDKITNFDPYNLHYNLNTLNKPIDQETIDANNRMSVFLHETLFEHEDTQFKLNFIPKNKFFDNRKIENKSELIITMNPSEIFWKFHDDTYVTIEDIYYSILYAIKTNKNLPEFYNTSVDVIKKFDQNYDAVFGSRMKSYKSALKGGMPFYKFLGNIALTFIQNIVLGSNISEFHSGYRSFKVNCSMINYIL